MKCDEIGRWFIDDVKERWSVMLFDVSCPVEDTLDRMDVDLVRRRCDQMSMWDTGYEVPVPVYEDCP